MSEQTMAEALREGLRDVLAADERVILLGEDVEAGGVFRITEGLFDEFGPRRVFDTPLAESGFTGAAIGAALAGLRPIVEIQFVDFILPAVNQLISEAAKMRWRSQGEWHVPLVVRAPWGGGVHGGPLPLAVVRGAVRARARPQGRGPGHPGRREGAAARRRRRPRPGHLSGAQAQLPADQGRGAGSPARRRHRRGRRCGAAGSDVTLIAYGLMLHECLAAAETLAGEGIDCHVLDLRSIAPLDTGRHPRRRPTDREGRHRARRSPHRRHRRRGRGADRGPRLRPPRRPHPARRRPRCARHGLPPQPRIGLHARTPPASRRPCAAWRPTELSQGGPRWPH